MLMSDLQSKDIINVTTGTKIGRIIDINVSNDGVINFFVVGEVKMIKRIRESAEYKISFSQIKRIGTDVILVELS